MRPLWTLFKVFVGLAIAVPVVFLASAMALGIVGAIVGLALRLAILMLVGYGAYRLGRAFLGSPRKPKAPEVHNLPSPDPYYDSAMRELDAELRGS